MKLSRKIPVSVVGVLVLFAMTASIVNISSAKANKPSLSKKITIEIGKAKTLSIKKNGFKIKSVKASLSNKDVAQIKATKKAVIIKGVKEGTTTITTKIKAKKNSAVKTYTTKTKVTIKPYLSVGVAVKKLNDFDTTLSSTQGKHATLTLSTKESGKIVIGENDYSTIDLVIDAPNVTFENRGIFKSITIKSGMPLFTEKSAIENNILVDSKAQIKILVDATAQVRSVTYSSDCDKKAELDVYGKISSVYIKGATPVSISLNGVPAWISDVYITSKGATVDINAGMGSKLENVSVEKPAKVSVSGNTINPIKITAVKDADIINSALNVEVIRK